MHGQDAALVQMLLFGREPYISFDGRCHFAHNLRLGENAGECLRKYLKAFREAPSSGVLAAWKGPIAVLVSLLARRERQLVGHLYCQVQIQMPLRLLGKIQCHRASLANSITLQHFHPVRNAYVIRALGSQGGDKTVRTQVQN